MCRTLGFGWIERCTSVLPRMVLSGCILGLGLLASCAGADDGGQAQSFAAHINGSYTAAAVSTSTR
jgi:hypothetical protein